MIYELYSDLSSFKNISFKSGMNLIVADKSEDSKDQSTRNKTGKTSIVELIHFLLGSNCDKSCKLRNDVLKENYFSLDLDLEGVETTVSRCGDNPNKFYLTYKKGDRSHLLINDYPDEKILTKDEWRNQLGYIFFNLPIVKNKKGKDKFQPTFRSLFSYFARRENDGGILSYERQSEAQNKWDQQVALSFLFGLDWTISSDWEKVRVKEKELLQLKRTVGAGAFGEIIGTTSQIRTSLAIIEKKAIQLQNDLESFKVLPEYEKYENEASQLTQNLANLANENIVDVELINELNNSIYSELPPSYNDLEKLYSEFKVIFPDHISRRLEEVKSFHDVIIRNRKLYLQSEIESAKERINGRNKQKAKIIDRRAEVMSILNSHGALDQYTKMSLDLTKIQLETESLRKKYNAAEQLEEGKIELNIERKNLEIRLQRNFQEQNELMKHIIQTFESISSRLYEDPGRLEIKASENGPVFEIKIQGESSKGIRNMQIFCFDMMLMILCRERGVGPDFLIHDSHVFDGVDSNQIASAFQVGAEMADIYDFQYIITMNSCDMPYSDFNNNFDVNKYILPIGITDSKEDGGLFGFRF